MAKTTTVTVGIPAFNEEQNIKNLLTSVLSQKTNNFKIKQIIIVSDCSTDNTIREAKSIKDKRIKILNNKKRIGVAYSQNKIIQFAKGDILILLDADIIPKNKNFIDELIKPIIKNEEISLVGADTESIKPKSYFEKVISDSHEVKKKIYKKIKNGNNVYMCHGRARAFSKKLYPKLVWPKNAPEDAFSYLYCVQKNFNFKFAPKAIVLFKSPDNFSDHKKQSERFVAGMNTLKKFFPEQLVNNEYKIPKPIIAKVIFENFIKNPIGIISFILITLFIRRPSTKQSNYAKWEISKSTKRIAYEAK